MGYAARSWWLASPPSGGLRGEYTPSPAGLGATLLLAGGSGGWRFVGSNTTETHPVISTFLREAVVHHGAKLIVVDPRQIEMPPAPPWRQTSKQSW